MQASFPTAPTALPPARRPGPLCRPRRRSDPPCRLPADPPAVRPADARRRCASGCGYLSMSPTTKNMLPRMAIMSGIIVPGSSAGRAEMLLKLAERSLSRHGVLSPRETR